MSRLLLATALWFSAAVCFTIPGNRCFAEPPPATKLVKQSKLLIIAHRGNSSKAPENTLPAFRSAAEAGADLIELDYYHAADNVPVVFHDKTLDRTTDAVTRWQKKKALLTDYSSKQLRKLDAGSWFDKSFRGTRIPTLRESLQLIQRSGTTLIEHKGGNARHVLRLLADLDFSDRVVLQSFDWDFLAKAHRANPQLTLAALGKKEVTGSKLKQIEDLGARVVAWNHKDLDQQAISRIHARGLKAWCYTVNERQAAKRLIRIGIDGIITDRPVEMMQLRLRQR